MGTNIQLHACLQGACKEKHRLFVQYTNVHWTDLCTAAGAGRGRKGPLCAARPLGCPSLAYPSLCRLAGRRASVGFAASNQEHKGHGLDARRSCPGLAKATSTLASSAPACPSLCQGGNRVHLWGMTCRGGAPVARRCAHMCPVSPPADANRRSAAPQRSPRTDRLGQAPRPRCARAACHSTMRQRLG